MTESLLKYSLSVPIHSKWLFYPWTILVHQREDGSLIGITTYNIEEDDGEFDAPDD